jgi:porin
MFMNRNIHCIFATTIMMLALCGPAVTQAANAAPAAETSDTIWTRDTLTGDWGGLRSDLTDKGIDLDLRLSQYGQRVVTGGVNVNGEYGGTMDYRLNVDTNKLFGTWEGLSVNMHARTRFGEDVNADAGSFALQNTGMLMPAPGDYEDTDITGLTVSQYLPFFNGGLANLTIGKFDIVDTVTGFFPSLGYGQEGFWNINATVTTMPWVGAVQGLSLYGVIGVTVNQEYGMPQSGLVVLGTENVSKSWGNVSDSFDDGTWLAGFHRFFWKMDDKPGYFMVFGGYSTRDQASNDPHDFVFVPGQGVESTSDKNPWDIAVYISQDFWQAEGDSNRKATLFMGGTAGPDNPQLVQYHAFANVETFGLLDSRQHDRMGAGVWWNGISDEFERLVSPVVKLQDSYGVEVYYNVEINKWLHLTADLQLIENERREDDLAVIPGLRLVMDF